MGWNVLVQPASALGVTHARAAPSHSIVGRYCPRLRGVRQFAVAIKLKIPKRRNGGIGNRLVSRDPVIRIAVALFVIFSVTVCAWFSFYYIKYGRIIDQRFKGPVFSSSATIYAIPRAVKVGEKIDLHEVASELRRAGYVENDGRSAMGSYTPLKNGIEINPGAQSYHSPEPATIRVQDGHVSSIAGRAGDLEAYELEPRMITALFDAEQTAFGEIQRHS